MNSFTELVMGQVISQVTLVIALGGTGPMG
ncbi:Uncharacterised protein [Mycobacteroides abscessus]|nr:Uncharacterised protein [Mycobacteroides abscessus]